MGPCRNRPSASRASNPRRAAWTSPLVHPRPRSAATCARTPGTRSMHERGNGGARFRPATSPLILGFGPSLRITDPRNGSVVRRRSFVAGVHDSYVVTESPPYQHGIEVRLTPLGGYSLLRVPMHTLANRAVALEDVLGPEASTLADHL